ncbi:MAG: hypothetical protein E7773_10115 [Sphingomonas sp.]|uniref:hypothetical protein n=1 Tax=Sphingomonas sp. TaxID=28214 RepID=UPI0012036BC4|nr:hypothetical protein [Sphingomonas sp.]THD35692.1 MAG: hypothetical protein E7773_10115 [Sphingomonas sp.]
MTADPMAHLVDFMLKHLLSTEIWAREAVKHAIREIYIHNGGSEIDEIAVIRFDRQVHERTSLSQAYAMLNAAQRAELRRAIENPDVKLYSNGELQWIPAQQDVLSRLEAGVEVGPTTQTFE